VCGPHPDPSAPAAPANGMCGLCWKT
jgi:hypothetical protein